MNADGQPMSAALLQQKLDLIITRNSKLEAEYLEILQDKLGLETAIEDLREPSREPEENVPFLEQRKKLQTTQSELAELRDQHFSLNAELASIKDRLLATEKNKEGRSLDSDTEYQTLSERYAELQEHSQRIVAELAEQKSLLRHALLSPSALSREPSDVRAGNEYKIIVQQLHAVQETSEDSDVLENTAATIADRIETSRAEATASNKVRSHNTLHTDVPLTINDSAPKFTPQKSRLSRRKHKQHRNVRPPPKTLPVYSSKTSS